MKNNGYYVFIFLYCTALCAMDKNSGINSFIMTKDSALKGDSSSDEDYEELRAHQARANQKYCPDCWNNQKDAWYCWVCDGCWQGIVTVCCYDCCLKSREK